MSYTAIALLSVAVVLVLDLLVLRTRMVLRPHFWIAYAIMIGFQFLTNAVLTGSQTVQYADAAIVGVGNDTLPGQPPFIGGGRLFYAPVEDVSFGFALVLLTLAVWQFIGDRGLQAGPRSGPPMWRRGASPRSPGR